MLEIITLAVLSDNYIYLVHDSQNGETATIDPALAQPVLMALQEKGWQLTTIFNTHHHSDHVGGNLELKARTGCKIIASVYDRNRIPGLDATVKEGDMVSIGQHKARVIFTPGHTLGHIQYYFKQDKLLFCGDTLFAMGCGRLFEGTAEQMWQSLQKLKSLPPDTQVYCTHEYTQNNGRFALTIDPDNKALLERMVEVNRQRAQNLPTLPTTIAEELETNPFFREDSASIRRTLNMVADESVDVFAKIRLMKDSY
ncbi:hydroxyacylglutathione hydrolase [biofilm metagenome]